MTEGRLPVEEACRRVVAGVSPLPAERVALEDALGRVLARDVVSRVTLPPWENSAMDGFACRAADVAGATDAAPSTLRVVDSIAAGAFPSRAIVAGEAARIMTGAPVPEGADTVIRVEDTTIDGDRVLVRDPRDAGRNVRARGEDVREGDTVLPAGTAVTPGVLGVLASVGEARPAVHRRPRVAILGSGDELVGLDRFEEVVAGRRIVGTNGYTLAALVRQAGGDPVELGTVPDDAGALREALGRAAGCDLLLTSAGVSVGDSDLVRGVMASLGGTLHFWRARIRPGGPFAFGTLGATPWLGLPGNPVSAMVTFELFARPALRRMLGHRRVFPRMLPVIVDEEVSTAAPLTHFLRVVVRQAGDGRLHARLTGPQGSGLLTSMARADALLVVPETVHQVAAGSELRAILLGEGALLAEDPS